MGNTPIEIIRNFISQTNEKDMTKLTEKDVVNHIANIYTLFQRNPNAFEEFKKNEESLQLEQANESYNHNNENNDDENNTQEKKVIKEEFIITETNKFFKIISSLIKYKYDPSRDEVYNQIVFLMQQLTKELKFIEYFFANSYEKLSMMMILLISHPGKREFVVNSLNLCNDIIKFFIQNHNAIPNNIFGINKLLQIPKVMSNELYGVNETITNALVKLLYTSIQLMICIQKSKRLKQTFITSSHRTIAKKHLNDYFQNNIFFVLSESLHSNQIRNQKYRLIISNIFSSLCEIKSVFTEGLIRTEKEFLSLFSLVIHIYSSSGESNSKKELNKTYGSDVAFLENMILFVVKYINNSNVTFKVLNDLTNDCITSLYYIYQNYPNKDIQFLLCCFFYLIGIDQEGWYLLSKGHDIPHKASVFIYNYIQDLFIHDEDSVYFTSKIKYLDLLISLYKYSLIKGEQNLIIHTECYLPYTKTISLLLYINYPLYRTDILRIANYYTILMKTKPVFAEDQEIITLFFTRLNQLFEEIVSSSSLYTDLNNQKQEMLKREEKMAHRSKRAIDHKNMSSYDGLINKTKELFCTCINDFFLLISILTNIFMINPNMQKSLIRLSNEIKMDYFEKDSKLAEYQDFLNKTLVEPLKHILIHMNDNNTKDATIKEDKKSKHTGKYFLYIPFLRIIYNPRQQKSIEFQLYKNNNHFIEYNFSFVDLSRLVNWCLGDDDILHKAIFIIHSITLASDDITQSFSMITGCFDIFINIITDSTFQYKSYVYRECFRLFASVLSNTESTLLWLKMPTKYLLDDYSNMNKVNLIYEDKDINWDLKPLSLKYQEENEEQSLNQETVIHLPFDQIKPYDNLFGACFCGRYYIEIQKPIHLDKSFTICFRFFNEINQAKDWRTLIQDMDGKLNLIAINPKKNQLGFDDINDNYHISSIDLNKEEYHEKWLSVALSVNEHKESYSWYLNGKLIETISSKGINFPESIKYIGNSKTFDKPFGAFCDIRVFNKGLEETELNEKFFNIKKYNRLSKDSHILYSFSEKMRMTSLISNNISSNPYVDNELLEIAMKVINKLSLNQKNRTIFNNTGLFLMSTERWNYLPATLKFEISKYINNIS